MKPKETELKLIPARLCCALALGVGASFTQATAATFSDANWTTVGSGVGGAFGMYTLAVSGNDLYAGGYFVTAGGVSANRIAKWDGSSWSALGSGMNGTVNALAVLG